MYFDVLQLRNFRNYSGLKIQLNPQANVLVGENGQGKTNFLEALYILSKGSSFKPGGYQSWIPSGTDSTSATGLSTKVVSRKWQSTDSIEITVSDRKSIKVNSKPCRASKLFEIVPSILFSPESLSSIKSGPEERRSLIDETVMLLDPGLTKSHARLIRAHRARNQLLKEIRSQPQRSDLKEVLEDLSFQFLSLSAEWVHHRLVAIRSLSRVFNAMSQDVLGMKSVDISVDYLMSESSVLEYSTEQLFAAMHTRANQLKSGEIESGTSLVGPHKHDIRFLYGNRDSRLFCSQGQQRALILAYKMAQVLSFEKQYQDYPVLLLDDVLSELDAKRRDNLITFLAAIRSQIVLTTTDISFQQSKLRNEMTVYQVRAGQVSAGEQGLWLSK